MEKDLTTSYLLASVGLFFPPFSGLHLFYLRQPVLGFAYLFTFGFCGIGTVIDLLRMPSLVDAENMRVRMMYGGAPPLRQLAPPRQRAVSAEQQLLVAAKEHDGALTVALASLETGIPLDECRRMLEDMAKARHCHRDVTEQADDLYVFPGLRSNKPFELD